MPRRAAVKKRAPSKEHLLQSAYVSWFRLQYPKILLFAVPNAARRSPRLGAYLKAEGMLAGVADLCILYPTTEYHSLWIEFKAGKNKPTDAQLDFLKYANSHNYAAVVCYDLDTAIAVTKEYLAC